MLTGNSPTILQAFELPWDGNVSSEQKQIFAAASSSTSGWTGSALYAVLDGALAPIGQSGRRRSIVGSLLSGLSASAATILDRGATVDVTLASGDFELLEASMTGLGKGSNRALIGSEIVQFASPERLDETTWRLGNLLRGRGGTEPSTALPKPVGTSFVLLDDAPAPLDIVKLGQAVEIAAAGLADPNPVVAQIANAGASLRPLCPVHPRSAAAHDGSIALSWTRRARGAWQWLDEVETPLNEQSEAYVVGLGDTANPTLRWETAEPCLTLSAQAYSALQADHSGQSVWVRQIGTHSSSEPLHILTII